MRLCIQANDDDTLDQQGSEGSEQQMQHDASCVLCMRRCAKSNHAQLLPASQSLWHISSWYFCCPVVATQKVRMDTPRRLDHYMTALPESKPVRRTAVGLEEGKNIITS